MRSLFKGISNIVFFEQNFSLSHGLISFLVLTNNLLNYSQNKSTFFSRLLLENEYQTISSFLVSDLKYKLNRYY